jgi:inorganic pyrophosphatase/exopolyphosphatase
MIIITSGGAYTDIDAYAGCVAYAELLRLQGKNAEAVLEPPLNASVPPYLRNLPVQYSRQYQPDDTDQFVLIDISDESVFAPFVAHDRISEIIDHHPGFERYWAGQKHIKAQIEVVGAACTQVFERWQDGGVLGKLPAATAQLLMGGILDNTLGLKAHITTARDVHAYEQLQSLVGDHGTFIEQYF